MSFKTCLLVPALFLSACGPPYVQGVTTATDETEGTDSAGTSETSGTTGPTTGIGPGTDPGTSIGTSDPAESCDDGVHNQDESDVDCGGSCLPCDGDAMCGGDADCKSGTCITGSCLPLARSCLELIMVRPGLVSDSYPLDPDGDGADPQTFFCDMEPPNPGWTQVFIDALDPAPAMGVWDPVVTGECGEFGGILGPYGMGDSLALAVTAQQVPHTELRVVADAVIMDSWDLFDNDKLQVLLDGAEIVGQNCDEPKTEDNLCGQTMDLCNNAMFKDGKVQLASLPVAHAADAIALSFTSNLNQPIDDESWGLDKIVVFVK